MYLLAHLVGLSLCLYLCLIQWISHQLKEFHDGCFVVVHDSSGWDSYPTVLHAKRVDFENRPKVLIL